MLIKPTLVEFELSCIRGTKSFPRGSILFLSCAQDEALLTSVFKCFEYLGLLFDKSILTVRYITVSDKLYFISSSVIDEMPFFFMIIKILDQCRDICLLLIKKGERDRENVYLFSFDYDLEIRSLKS